MQSKIKFRDVEKLSEQEKNEINARLANFEEKNKGFFSEMHLNIDCKPGKEKLRGKKAYRCRINAVTDKGRFHAEESTIGAENSVIRALKKIERQILRI
ncbi:hypothetical protein GF323_04955 [Candidatus Woesearchaeota archaeon]|nr:hypothetical protein [Candidatus Woesearchaeota archaeon]